MEDILVQELEFTREPSNIIYIMTKTIYQVAVPPLARK